MNYAEIELAIAALGEKARKGTLAVEDMDGGTFTISNGGVFGSLMGTPIINPPQSAILGMHAIFDRPVAIKGQVSVVMVFLLCCFSGVPHIWSLFTFLTSAHLARAQESISAVERAHFVVSSDTVIMRAGILLKVPVCEQRSPHTDFTVGLN
jgi:hypothetical protein